MDIDRGHVMLVGSVARPEDNLDVADVFRVCAEALDGHVSKLPDGEVGDRYFWINYIARHTYSQHADMVTVSRHTYEDWKPTSYPDHWKFTLRDGVSELRFDRIGYAAEAIRSYREFVRLREAGSVSDSVRFMVALPLIESATRPFIDTAANWEIVYEAYADAISRELDEICAAIPHDDLAIQWDVCLETAAAEGIPINFSDDGLTNLSSSPIERLESSVARVATHVPEPVWLGFHICYGSLGHEDGKSADSGHFKEIQDLGVSVQLANACAGAAGRSTHFVHMAVQNSRGYLDEYYEPLTGLNVGDARLYLGLIHLHDGQEGAKRRIEIAAKYTPDFGFATQCGWGRRPASESLESLLDLHRDIADSVVAAS